MSHIWVIFLRTTHIYIFFFTAISLFRCIVHKNDIELKHNLKHNICVLDCPAWPEVSVVLDSALCGVTNEPTAVVVWISLVLNFSTNDGR